MSIHNLIPNLHPKNCSSTLKPIQILHLRSVFSNCKSRWKFYLLMFSCCPILCFLIFDCLSLAGQCGQVHLRQLTCILVDSDGCQLVSWERVSQHLSLFVTNLSSLCLENPSFHSNHCLLPGNTVVVLFCWCNSEKSLQSISTGRVSDIPYLIQDSHTPCQ